MPGDLHWTEEMLADHMQRLGLRSPDDKPAKPVRKPRTRTPQIREADIERACSEILQLDGWRMLKTDPCSDKKRGKGFGEKGMADCLYIRYTWGGLEDNNLQFTRPATMMECRALAQVLWIEWKRPGNSATPLQIQWHRNESLRGALTWIAGEDFLPTIEGFAEFYRCSPFCRKVGVTGK